MKRLNNFFRNIEKKYIKNSMLFQIIFYYLIGNLIFIIFLSSIFYYSSKYIIINNEIKTTKKNAIKSSEYISLYIDKLKNLINILSLNSDISKVLISDDEKAYKNVEKIINLLIEENKESIKSITIVGKNGNTISNEKILNMMISPNMLKEKWYVNAINNTDMPTLNPIRKKENSMDMDDWVISISKDVKDEKGNNLGVIVFDIKYQVFSKYLKDLSNGEKNDNLIIDKNNNIIYYKDVKCFIDKECINKFLSKNKEYKNVTLIEVEIENTNWKLISFSEMTDLLSLKRNFFDMILAILLISITFSSIITFIIIKKFIIPLIKLKNHIENFQNKLTEFSIDGNISYEIMVLTKYFNMMIEKIKYLREYEIKALHSQINPHFLYNTLDTIIWMAEFGNSDDVINITKSLANFFRLSLSNGNEKITLNDEIKHVKEYLFIQKKRYEEKLNYKFKVDENLLKLKVPKIIIQPIVENSIYHGIKNILENGMIEINIFKEDNILNIFIKDNGIGFEKSKKIKTTKIGGVGIKNVDKRIKFYYGENYGIKIKNIEKGSLVVITLPIDKLKEGI